MVMMIMIKSSQKPPLQKKYTRVGSAFKQAANCDREVEDGSCEKQTDCRGKDEVVSRPLGRLQMGCPDGWRGTRGEAAVGALRILAMMGW